MIATRSMTSYAKTVSRWSRRTDPIAASAPRKMDDGFGDMPGAGWLNASSPGYNGSVAFLSAGSFIRRTSLASCSSPASSSSSDDFEIGSSIILDPGGLMTETLLPTSLVGSYAQPNWLIDRKRLAERFPPRVRAGNCGRVRRNFSTRRRTTPRCSPFATRSAQAWTSSPTASSAVRAIQTGLLEGVDIDNPATALDR